MQVRRLRYDLAYWILGQIINVTVDVWEIVENLLSTLNEDRTINVSNKRNQGLKSEYLSGCGIKQTIRACTTKLHISTLYRLFNMDVDINRLNSLATDNESQTEQQGEQEHKNI